MIGEKILNYRIDSLLGTGGIGTVYLATHTQLGRKVAIKVLNPLLVNHQEIKERFRNEATTLSSLQHLNIITLYDYLEEERGLFLIMEYAEGSPLDQYIQKTSGPIPEQKTIFFFNQLLDGFAYAHQQGVIHRDIKPSNIIVTKEADIKILDFGIAKILKEDRHSMTKTGAKLGTVLYMSPEQVQGKAADKRTDVYSLGITLFEMLTGRCPYDAQSHTEYEIYDKIVKSPLPSAKTFYPAVSDRMQALIDKATAKDPDQRFQSCEEFKDALNQTSLQKTIVPSKNLQATKVDSGEPEHNTIGKKRNPSTLILYAFLGIVLMASFYVIYKEFSKTPTSPNEEYSYEETEDSSTNDDTEESNAYEEYIEDVIEEKAQGEEQKQEASPAQKLLDSLNSNKKQTREFTKLLEKERRQALLRGLLVDGQFESEEFGELIIQVTVANQREDADFKNIIIIVNYFNDNDEIIKTREQELEPLTAGNSITFRVRETIENAKFTCKIKRAEPVDLDPPFTLDSLRTALETIDERIRELEKEIKEED